MIRWGLRSLLADRASFLASCGGVAVAFLLILLIEGMFVGESSQIVSYLRHTRAQVWVMQEGVSNMHMASSFILSDRIDEVRAVPGVALVTPILYVNSFVRAGDAENFSYIVGLPPGAEDGGPWQMAAGKSEPGAGEAVIPEVLGRKVGAGIGDEVTISGTALRVVGLTEGTFSMANPIVFVAFEQLENILDTYDVASYLLVVPDEGIPATELAGHIRTRVEDVSVVDRETFISNDFQLGMQMGGDLIAIMAIIAAIVGVLVVAWTIYSFITRHVRELAITRAIGATNREIIASVLVQSLVLATAGYALACGVAFALEPALEALAPEVAVRFAAASMARAGIVAAFISVIAAIIPTIRVVRVDPAEVFNA